jgi:hypothetical protein
VFSSSFQKYLVAAFGVMLLAFSTLIFPPDLSQLNKSNDVSTSVHELRWEKLYRDGSAGNFDGMPISKPGLVEWQMELAYPSEVVAGSSIFVKAIPKIVSIKAPEVWRYKSQSLKYPMGAYSHASRSPNTI